MKRLPVFFLLLGIIFISIPSQAQLIRKAGELIQTAFNDSRTDSLSGAPDDTLTVGERLKRDSVRLHEMTLQLQEMKMQEIMLRSQLDEARNINNIADSLKLAAQRRSIDSLRATTTGVPVVVESDTLFLLYAGRGGQSAHDRAEMASEILLKIGKNKSLTRDTVYCLVNEGYSDIMYGRKVIISITDQDALWENVTRQELVDRYSPLLADKIKQLKDEHNFLKIIERAVLFVLVIFIQYLLFKLTNFLFRKLRRQIIRFKQQRLHPLIIRDYELLNTRLLGKALIFLSNLVRYAVLFLQLMFIVPILFAIFPQTEDLALKIFLYIIEPVKMVIISIVEYIPNLFIIIVIWYCIKYIIKGLRYVAKEIESGKLKISGFYPDWAHPTFNIIRFLLYAFMIAMIYPYLPGSNSGVFQGISVFVGLIISLGSSSVIGNIMSGLVITYMRPFKIGDCIKLNDTIGNVIEKTPFVTRIRTLKNEVVTIPNSFIMSSHTVNFSSSARKFGLIIHTTVTFGYDVPWRQVHELLINAALATKGILHDPKPFVLETELQDFYPSYQLNAYIKNADEYLEIKSELLQNVQDQFKGAGLDLVCTHYISDRGGFNINLSGDAIHRQEFK